MMKAILSPYFIMLVILWPLLAWQFLKKWKDGWSSRMVSAIAILALFSVTVLGFINVNKWLCRHLELEGMYDFTCPADAIVVLGGGYVSGSDLLQEQLNPETVFRMLKGVQVYDECKSRYFVISGTLRDTPKGSMTKVMRDLVKRMGISEERILIETESVNTREHPIYVRNMGIVDENARIAIVTSPWHLHRAMVEFRRVFPNSIPVASYKFPSDYSSGWSAWLPNISILGSSTAFLHEYIGMLWYEFLHKKYFQTGAQL